MAKYNRLYSQDIYLEDDSIEKNISFEQDENKIDSKQLKK